MMLGLGPSFRCGRPCPGSIVDQGFTRQASCRHIWRGRVGELNFKARRLGTFDVAVDPMALLTGAVTLELHRLNNLRRLGRRAGLES